MDITEKIRIKLKKSREAMNLSLENVAAVSGLKKEELEDIEKGSKEISIAILEKLVFVKRKVYQFSVEKYTIILKKLMAF